MSPTVVYVRGRTFKNGYTLTEVLNVEIRDKVLTRGVDLKFKERSVSVYLLVNRSVEKVPGG